MRRGRSERGALRVTPAAGLALLLLAGACSHEPANEYPPEVVDNFIGACRTRAPEVACRCAIDRLRDRFSWEEFREMERRMRADDLPPEVADAVRGCVER
jgi:hypothetical protein